MNLFLVIRFARNRINRAVSPEAKQVAWQAMLGLKNAVGESLIKLLFRWALNDAIRDVLDTLLTIFTA
ncbi:hypothetical protein [Massilia sp. LjRoot122]|uniref:hypothetical protein n=1 Tax=Massilia sp. LjRoot122 TaxID=3342257 RepID=UPI003ECDF336